MNKYLMTNMTWKEYEAKKDRILILPIGSTEQHGPASSFIGRCRNC